MNGFSRTFTPYERKTEVKKKNAHAFQKGTKSSFISIFGDTESFVNTNDNRHVYVQLQPLTVDWSRLGKEIQI